MNIEEKKEEEKKLDFVRIKKVHVVLSLSLLLEEQVPELIERYAPVLVRIDQRQELLQVLVRLEELVGELGEANSLLDEI